LPRGDEYGCKKKSGDSSSMSSTTTYGKGNTCISTVNDNGNVLPTEELLDEQLDDPDVHNSLPQRE
jgi:hypothetical protein